MTCGFVRFDKMIAESNLIQADNIVYSSSMHTNG